MPSGTWLLIIGEYRGGSFTEEIAGADTHTRDEQNLPQQESLLSDPEVDGSGSPE